MGFVFGATKTKDFVKFSRNSGTLVVYLCYYYKLLFMLLQW